MLLVWTAVHTHGVHDEIQLPVVDGDVDSGAQQLVDHIHHRSHEVSRHVAEHFLRLAWTHSKKEIKKKQDQANAAC